jgi:ABC-type antimicrobial peptide transport system permease subunit
MKSIPSDRAFGFLMSAVLISAGLFAFLTNQATGFWPILLLFGVFFLSITFVSPKYLRPLSRAWFLLGEMLGRFVSPVVLMIIFFGLLTPIGVLTRLFGRDELRLHKREGGSSWVTREQTEVTSESFKNQY